jgi:trans-aconitate methyltransferase
MMTGMATAREPAAGWTVELDTTAGRRQSQEEFLLHHADGTDERITLHDYGRVYSVPGLYEEVVQHRLECASPATVAAALVEAATDEGRSPSDLRAFDLGAGNGVVGEELHARGAQVVAGIDGVVAARDAARRDRPELYEVYAIAGVDEVTVEQLVADHGLNALTAAGALGIGHVEVSDVARWWAAFPPGSWFAATVPPDVADPAGEDLLGALLAADPTTQVVRQDPFAHRRRMSGEAITYNVVVARKT